MKTSNWVLTNNMHQYDVSSFEMKGGRLKKLLFIFFLIRNILRTNYFLSYWVFYVPVYIFTPELEKYLVLITAVLCAGM